MGVSSTRVGDHRGSARTVQFLSNSFSDDPHSEVRTFQHFRRSFLPTIHKSFSAVSCSVRLLTLRRVFSFNVWAGSGLPFLWWFDSTTALRSTPLHPNIFISFLLIRISGLLSISFIYFIHKSPACLLPLHPLPYILFTLCFSFLYQSFLCTIFTHKPSSFPNNLQVLLFCEDWSLQCLPFVLVLEVVSIYSMHKYLLYPQVTIHSMHSMSFPYILY